MQLKRKSRVFFGGGERGGESWFIQPNRVQFRVLFRSLLYVIWEKEQEEEEQEEEEEEEEQKVQLSSPQALLLDAEKYIFVHWYRMFHLNKFIYLYSVCMLSSLLF